jgi:hypothetical protein
MDDSELFDIFDVDNNPEPVQKSAPAPVQRSKSHKKKSKKDTSESQSNGIANGKRPHDSNKDTGEEVEERETPVKKVRKIVQDPIVVDSFETESDQIVPATTGLQGTLPTDANIVIKKRVPTPPYPLIPFITPTHATNTPVLVWGDLLLLIDWC